jgi:hypothetical protein
MFKHEQMRAVTWHVGQIYKKHVPAWKLRPSTLDANVAVKTKKSHIVSSIIAAFFLFACNSRPQPTSAAARTT